MLVVWSMLIGSVALALPPGATWGAEGQQRDAWMGLCSGVLDVNGDGFDDVFAGVHGFDRPEDMEGGVALWLGSSVGLPAAPSWTMEGDQVGATAGSCAARAGDVNADGYDDLVVGLSGFSHGQVEEGAAVLYLGGPNGLSAAPSWAAESDSASAGFGRAVGAAGDVNGDGYDDLVVGAPWQNGAVPSGGAASVYLGGPAGPSPVADWTIEGDSPLGYFGFAATSAGDVNADGFDDLVVGAYAYGRQGGGAAFLYLGSAAGPSLVEDWSIVSRQSTSELGAAVAGIGDVNGDGYDDLAVGADRYSHGEPEEGVVAVFHGSPNGPSATPDWTAEADVARASFGKSLAGADLDGDGFSDLVIGASDLAHGQASEGAVYVYRGSLAGLSAAPALRLESDQADAELGKSVSAGADTDGDGRLELLVGANHWSNGQSNEGGIFLYEAP